MDLRLERIPIPGSSPKNRIPQYRIYSHFCMFYDSQRITWIHVAAASRSMKRHYAAVHLTKIIKPIQII
jgi:hypothetical protein